MRTVGIKLGHDKSGRFYLPHIVYTRSNPGDVEKLLLNTAAQDGTGVRIGFGQDPGDRREPIAIANIVHLLSDHIRAGRTVGLALLELREQLVNEEWVGTNLRPFGEPRLAAHLGNPVSFGMVWARDNRRGRT
jgi:hypothetical protein